MTAKTKANPAVIHPVLGDLAYYNGRKFKPGQIIARLGRNMVQKSYDKAWPRFAVFGAQPSAWYEDARQAVDVLIANHDPTHLPEKDK